MFEGMPGQAGNASPFTEPYQKLPDQSAGSESMLQMPGREPAIPGIQANDFVTPERTLKSLSLFVRCQKGMSL